MAEANTLINWVLSYFGYTLILEVTHRGRVCCGSFSRPEGRLHRWHLCGLICWRLHSNRDTLLSIYSRPCSLMFRQLHVQRWDVGKARQLVVESVPLLVRALAHLLGAVSVHA